MFPSQWPLPDLLTTLIIASCMALWMTMLICRSTNFDMWTATIPDGLLSCSFEIFQDLWQKRWETKYSKGNLLSFSMSALSL